jgi:hypothetical protein
LESRLDIKICTLHDVQMRTIIDLPEDLHGIVTSLASHTRRSLSQTTVDLIRRGLSASALAPGVDLSARVVVDPATGLAVLQTARVITPEDVNAPEDET